MFEFLLLLFRTPEVPETIIADLKKTIESNKVVVFSKSYCPYCTSTKTLLLSLNQNYELIELNQDSEGSVKQNGLLQLTGQRTVPNVFINGKHIGGNDVLQMLNAKGELKALLQG